MVMCWPSVIMWKLALNLIFITKSMDSVVKYMRRFVRSKPAFTYKFRCYAGTLLYILLFKIIPLRFVAILKTNVPLALKSPDT